MPYQLGLPNALKRFGLAVEVVDGWGTRGWSGFNPRGSVSHWTASPGAPRPSLGICIYGRPDLDGPLCNVFLDREGTAVVVAAGMANHAGPGGFNGMSGNDSVFGTECEGTIGDRDGTDFTDAQRAAYPRIVAAYHYLTRTSPLTHACGHSEWTSQKIDVGSYAPVLRRQAAAILADPTISFGDDDMQADERAALMEIQKFVRASKMAEFGGAPVAQHAANQATAALKSANAALAILKGPDPRWDMLQRLVSLATPTLAAVRGLDTATVDTDALAVALADAIPDDIAQRVIDELSARLKA